jgi:hypothetical protein
VYRGTVVEGYIDPSLQWEPYLYKQNQYCVLFHYKRIVYSGIVSDKAGLAKSWKCLHNVRRISGFRSGHYVRTASEVFTRIGKHPLIL